MPTEEQYQQENVDPNTGIPKQERCPKTLPINTHKHRKSPDPVQGILESKAVHLKTRATLTSNKCHQARGLKDTLMSSNLLRKGSCR